MSNISAEVSDAFSRKDAAGGHHFHSYVDGSGSTIALPRKAGHTVFDLASDAISRLAAVTGEKVEAKFWGDSKTHLMGVGANTPADYRLHMNTGCSLAPAIHEMQLEAAQPGQHHFMLYSDGDIGDYHVARDAMRDFLKTRQNATVNVIIGCERTGSWMQELTTALSTEFPGQMRVAYVHPDDKAGYFRAAESAVTARLGEKTAAPEGQTAKKAAAPGQKP